MVCHILFHKEQRRRFESLQRDGVRIPAHNILQNGFGSLQVRGERHERHPQNRESEMGEAASCHALRAGGAGQSLLQEAGFPRRISEVLTLKLRKRILFYE